MNDILANANNSLILSLSKDEPISPMEARASTGSARAVFFFLQKSLIRRFLFPAALIIGAVLRAAEGPVPPLPDFAPGDRVLFLSHGRILIEGDPKSLPREHGRKTLEELFIATAREPLTIKEA